MKTVFWLLLVLLTVPMAVRAQGLHPSFSFAREANNAGSTDYVLAPVIPEVTKKAGVLNRPYQILGALARPSTQRAVLMFANAQMESQLYSQNDKSVVITADEIEFKNLQYTPAARSEDSSPPRLEIANVLLDFKDFQKIATAGSVSVKFGAVTYQLDKDNIDALHYLAAEIEKDQKQTN